VPAAAQAVEDRGAEARPRAGEDDLGIACDVQDLLVRAPVTQDQLDVEGPEHLLLDAEVGITGAQDGHLAWTHRHLRWDDEGHSAAIGCAGQEALKDGISGPTPSAS
jgi:hypothetical protein